MKKIIIPFFCLTLFSTPYFAQTAKNTKVEAIKGTLTAKQVLDKYFEAMGGKQKLEAVKSVIIEGTMSVQGMEISSVTKKMGNKFKYSQTVMAQDMLQVFDGEKGYVKQMGKEASLTPEQIEKFKKGKTIDVLAMDTPEKMTSVTVEKLDGKDYNVLTSEKGKFYFDAATHLLYKTLAEGAEIIVKDYITQEGIKFPGTTEIKAQGQEIVMKNTKVTLNSGVTEADFK